MKPMNEPFSINAKFNVLHCTEREVKINLLKETSEYLKKCADIILGDDENPFSYEACKCYDRLIKKSTLFMRQALSMEIEDINRTLNNNS